MSRYRVTAFPSPARCGSGIGLGAVMVSVAPPGHRHGERVDAVSSQPGSGPPCSTDAEDERERLAQL